MAQGSPMAPVLSGSPSLGSADPFVEFSLGLFFTRSGQVSIPLLMHCGSDLRVEGQPVLLAMFIYFLFAFESPRIRAREIEGLQRKGGGFLLTWGFKSFSLLITDALDAGYPEARCSGRSHCGHWRFWVVHDLTCPSQGS